MKKQIIGNIHSIESFGTVDGPGIRFVVFLQGCPMRCQYCHNPDTWNYDENQKLSADEILIKYDGVKEFLKNGGLTVSGGEPLSQIEFVIDLFKKAKQKNIHTALDTSGILFNKKDTTLIDGLLKYTDIVMLDIKHINDEEHKKLTNFSNSIVLDFAKYLAEKEIPLWIRHVVVPTITYKEEYLQKLGEFLASLKNIKAIDVLPYHNMAIPKYEQLNIEYPLKHLPSLTKAEAMNARKIIFEAFQKTRSKN